MKSNKKVTRCISNKNNGVYIKCLMFIQRSYIINPNQERN